MYLARLPVRWPPLLKDHVVADHLVALIRSEMTRFHRERRHRRPNTPPLLAGSLHSLAPTVIGIGARCTRTCSYYVILCPTRLTVVLTLKLLNAR